MFRQSPILFAAIAILSLMQLHAQSARTFEVKEFSPQYAPGDEFVVYPNGTDQELLDALYPYKTDGVEILEIKRIGHEKSAGTYENMAPLLNVQIANGMLISSGHAKATDFGWRNDPDGWWSNEDVDEDDLSGNGDPIPGDERLRPFIQADVTLHEASIFEITFTTDASIKQMSFDFVYTSEEFPNYVGTSYNDVFVAFLNGNNISFDHDGKPLTVNNNFFRIADTTEIFAWADQHSANFPDVTILEVDGGYGGLTPVLRSVANLNAGTHTLSFSISDVGDEILNSTALLANLRFSTDTIPVGTIIIGEGERLKEQVFEVDHGTEGKHILGNVDVDAQGTKTVITNQTPDDLDLSASDYELSVSQGVTIDYSKQKEYNFNIFLEKETQDGIDIIISVDTIPVKVIVIPPDGVSLDEQVFEVEHKALENTEIGVVDFKGTTYESLLIEWEKEEYKDDIAFETSNGTISVATGGDIDHNDNDEYKGLVIVQKEFTADTIPIRIVVSEPPPQVDIPRIEDAHVIDTDGDGQGDLLIVNFDKNTDKRLFEYEINLDYASTEIFNKEEVAEKDVDGKTMEMSFDLSGFPGEQTGEFEVFFDSLGTIMSFDHPIKDEVGPVVTKAHHESTVRSEYDILELEFSEAIKDFINNEDYLYADGKPLDIVEIVNSEDNSWIVHVKKGVLDDVEEISFDPNGQARDSQDNKPHENNKPAKLTHDIEKQGIASGHCYHDANGDGFMDSISVKFNLPLNAADLGDLDIEAVWPDEEGDQMELNSKEDQLNLSDSVTVGFKLDSDSDLLQTTAISRESENVTVQLRKDEWVVEMKDCMSPVLIKAEVELGEKDKKDSLTLVFSEEVQDYTYENDNAFTLLVDDVSYVQDYGKPNWLSKSEVRLGYKGSDLDAKPLPGDSVYLHLTSSIRDEAENSPAENKVMITGEVPLVVDIIPFVELRDSDASEKDGLEIVSFNEKKTIREMQTDEGGVGIVIQIKDLDRDVTTSGGDDIEFIVYIYSHDAQYLNHLSGTFKLCGEDDLSDDTICLSQNGSIYIKWNAVGYNGRKAGTGAYLFDYKLKGNRINKSDIVKLGVLRTTN